MRLNPIPDAHVRELFMASLFNGTSFLCDDDDDEDDEDYDDYNEEAELEMMFDEEDLAEMNEG